MDHIEQHGLDVVGIYRLSGNAASVQKLRFIVEQGMRYSLVLSQDGVRYSLVFSQGPAQLFIIYTIDTACKTGWNVVRFVLLSMIRVVHCAIIHNVSCHFAAWCTSLSL